MSPLLHRAKKAALEKAVLLVLRPKVERYGEIRKLSLDTSAKKLAVEILLRGETESFKVSEAYYRIEERRGETILILHDVKVSREWAQNLLEDFFQEIPIKIPGFARLFG
jgi:hypothetical protein